MFHKIKNVTALPEYKLSVQFSEGVTKIYDVKPLFVKIPLFAELKENYQEYIEEGRNLAPYHCTFKVGDKTYSFYDLAVVKKAFQTSKQSPELRKEV